jgi:hypothetical protein
MGDYKSACSRHSTSLGTGTNLFLLLPTAKQLSGAPEECAGVQHVSVSATLAASYSTVRFVWAYVNHCSLSVTASLQRQHVQPGYHMVTVCIIVLPGNAIYCQIRSGMVHTPVTPSGHPRPGIRTEVLTRVFLVISSWQTARQEPNSDHNSSITSTFHHISH